MSLVVRAATVDDVAVVADLEELAFADAWSRNLVDEGVTGLLPTTSYVVADLDGGLVGYAVVSVVQDVAELQRIATAPAARRTGVATALLAAVLDRAAVLGAERVLLEVREDNAAARAFYERSGFSEIARRPRYYRDGTDAVVLETFVRMAP